jgi:uncharacterized protein YdaU (DUF1376 family)
MHYYKRNLGDYAKKAGRLTMLQHGAYTLLIDSCYDREVFPTLEQAIEWTWASTEAEVEAVKFVLDRFFILDESNKYIQDRILQELLEYHAKADKNKQIAIERETKRRENNTNRSQLVHETTPNHKPRTKNQEPLTKNHIKTPKVIAPEGVSIDLWNDFLVYRKRLKAPVSDRVLARLIKEAELAKMPLDQVLETIIFKGWRSFEASWIQQAQQKATELPLGTDQQIEEAYRVECGGDPRMARFNSYFEMKKFIQETRDKKRKVA